MICPGAVTFCADEFREKNVVGLLQCEFDLAAAEKLPVMIAGMAGYQLYLDKKLVHCGPEWSYDDLLIVDEITLELAAGKHQLEVLLWNHGLEYSALREMSRHAFFALWSEYSTPAADAVATDRADYLCCTLPGWQITAHHMNCMAGPRLDVDFRIEPTPWRDAVKLDKAFFQQQNYVFEKRSLPLDFNEKYHNFTLRSADYSYVPTAVYHEGCGEELANLGNALIRGEAVTVPRGKSIRLVYDLNDYICARAFLELSGGRGSKVEILLTESLFERSGDWVDCYVHPQKGDRSAVEGKYAVGKGDIFIAGGGEDFCPVLDWAAGRYLVIYINTVNSTLTIKNFALTQTHSGIKLTNPIRFADKELNQIADISLNALRNCMHTTYMDCPHYEQLMYIGDGRLEALINYVSAPGCLLQRKALKAFAASILDNGFTQTRYPSHEESLIPGFSLFFINMLHDYALWSSDKSLIAQLLPACRKILRAFEPYQTADGLFRNPEFWNFYDWVPGWERGVPPVNDEPGALMNLHMALVLQDLAELEEYAGEASNAPALRERAEILKQQVHQHFFVPEKGIYSCDKAHLHFSQHVQAMALLAGLGDRDLYEKIFDKSLDLAQCTIYFSHYLFEVAKLFNDSIHPLEMLDFWKKLPAMGLFTTPERPEPSRSDCHAWGGHILYYMVSGLAGVRPAKMGGTCFTVSPADLTGVVDFELDLNLSAGSIQLVNRNGKISVKASDSITLQQ